MEKQKEKIISYFNGEIEFEEIKALLENRELKEFFELQKAIHNSLKEIPYKKLPQALYKSLIEIPEKEEKSFTKKVYEIFDSFVFVFTRKEFVLGMMIVVLMILSFIPQNSSTIDYAKFKIKDEVKTLIEKGEFAKDVMLYNIESKRVSLGKIFALLKKDKGGENGR